VAGPLLLGSTLKYRSWLNSLERGPDAFATQIHKCDAQGIRSLEAPTLYEQHYNDLTQATVGHRKVVAALANGQLKLGRRSPPGSFTGAPAYCANCQAEYRAGFDQCSECQIPLIKKNDEISP
jgi:hypothetical protein